MTGSIQWRARGRRVLLWSGLALVGLLGLYAGYLWAVISLPSGEERPPVLLFGSPFILKPGHHVAGIRLEERLARLSYHPVRDEPSGPGEYRITEEAVDIYLHDDPDRFVRSTPVRLTLENGRITQVLSVPLGEPIPPVPLEPPLLGGLRGASRQVKQGVPLTAMPQALIDAVLAIEDHRYYQHVGLDPQAIARALWANLRSGEVVQGGSTITQQLAKNLFYSRERTGVRKIKEALAALMLELKYGKDEILESYLNEIYLGQVGSVSIYGVGEAARWYFGKPVQDLSHAEAALLAGIIKAPNGYSPLKNLALAKERRDLVLSHLQEEGKLSAPEREAAARQPVHVVPTP
ncbi:MAG: transglycosylase domain-containing protein, partial [Nitrospiraceae bacterium]